jgi:hypothetical protein
MLFFMGEDVQRNMLLSCVDAWMGTRGVSELDQIEGESGICRHFMNSNEGEGLCIRVVVQMHVFLAFVLACDHHGYFCSRYNFAAPTLQLQYCV